MPGSIGDIAFLCHSAFTAQQTKISVAYNESICSSLMCYMLTGAQLELAPGHASCLSLLHMAHIFLGQWDTSCIHVPGTCQAFAVLCPLISLGHSKSHG